jgi:LPPG:FO 2-phospho-L-lactate transferase
VSVREPQPSTGTQEDGKVVVLAGGTGGAKLARGMLDVVGPQRLVVIANTGDDIDIYGAHVSPDPDLISFWLADLIDERGWGIAGDTFEVMDGLRELGVDVWFNLGDRDLAWCIERRRMEDEGLTATAALRRLNERIGVSAQVLPMCDGALRVVVNGVGLQEFLIRQRGEGPVREVLFTGDPDEEDDQIRPTPEVLAALDQASAVVIGPSNPVISIWPILSVLEQALAERSAPVIAVSPIVGGEVLKGPTAAFLHAFHLPTSAAGVAAFYNRVAEGLLDGMVTDEPIPVGPPGSVGDEYRLSPRSGSEMTVPADLATLEIDTSMPDPQSRAAVAEKVLGFAESLSR